jgi:uncharacterized protein YodC (DUF2158 family)
MENEDDDISIGDVVRLKSGGPSMTVIDIGSSLSTVIWFDDDMGFHEACIPTQFLESSFG